MCIRDSLIILICVFIILLILINLYILANYTHPLESSFGTSVVPKIICVSQFKTKIIGMSLAQATVLMVPLDVANSRIDGGLDMKAFWYAICMMMCIFIFIFVPIALLFHESEGMGLVSLIYSEILNLVRSQMGIFLHHHCIACCICFLCLFKKS